LSGIDYSEICVEKTKRLVRRAVREGRADIQLSSVSGTPWPDSGFYVFTTFEPVYFRLRFAKDLRVPERFLRPSRTFLGRNEMNCLMEEKRLESRFSKIFD
jgi:hypothetical protein